MCSTQKQLTEEIKKRSDKFYYNNPELCAKHNLYKRCEVFIFKRKRIWPPIKSCDIREFVKITKLPNKFLKKIK